MQALMKALPAVFVILLLLAVPLSAQAGTDARFLGLALADRIGADKDGLTVLDGIRHAIWADTLPARRDLQIYTRWAGTGSHTIGVSIWNSDTQETLTETSDDVDFGNDPVTFYTHDFSGTKFPVAGTYAVEVTLDGDMAAEYAFYVNVKDQFPPDPELVLSVPARSGSVGADGSAGVSGIFEYFTFKSFPATDTFAIVTLWFSGSGRHDNSVRILGPSGETIATSRTAILNAGYGEMSEVTSPFKEIAFPSAGTYTAVLLLDGRKVFEYPLEIIQN
jgi:hypothetical protein